jgi:hypothetical protein
LLFLVGCTPVDKLQPPPPAWHVWGAALMVVFWIGWLLGSSNAIAYRRIRHRQMMAFFSDLQGSMSEVLKEKETKIEALQKKIKSLEDERDKGPVL